MSKQAMNKIYKFGEEFYAASVDIPDLPVMVFNGGEWRVIGKFLSGYFINAAKTNGFTPVANNYQEKPRCSQPDSRSSSCHASETTAKSSGLLSRICSVFSSNAKK